MKTPRKTGFVSFPLAFILCIVLFLVSICACSLPFLKSKKPKAPVSTAILRDPESGKLTQAGLQALVMDFCDKFVMTVWQATDEILKSEVDTEKRRLIHLARAMGSGSAMSIAAGRNPAANLLDMVTYVTLGRMNQEEYWVPKVLGPRGQPLLQAMRKLEQDIWTLSGEVLTEGQKEELRTMIREWRAAHPKAKYYMAGVGIKDLVKLRGESPVAGEKEQKGFLAEVGKALVKVDEAFLLAERGMFYVERMPKVVALQTDLLLSQIATTPMVAQIVADSNRATDSLANLVQTANTLPKVLAVERTAAIKQITDWLSQERQNLMTDLEGKDPQVKSLLREVRLTLATGAELTKALNLLASQFEDDPDAPSSPPVDYVKAMEKATKTLQQANLLVKSFNELVAGEEAEEEGDLLVALKQVNEETQDLLNHAFLLGLLLIVVFMVCLVVALVCYKLLTKRLVDSRRA